MTDDFRDKLRHILKVSELSRTRLAKLAGVDKSVASRWVSGATRPSEANLDALTRALNSVLPELVLSDWSRPLAEFLERFGSPVAGSNFDAAAPSPAGLPSRPSIAVLPFTNMSDDHGQDFFASGIAEDILIALARQRWLHVAARHSSFGYTQPQIDVRKIGHELGVRYVLAGSVRRSPDRVRITCQLADALSGISLWADRYDRLLGDIFTMQDEIVGAVLAAINPTIVDAERQRAFYKPTSSLDAWEAYQRGVWHHTKRNAEETERARALFQRAIELDPNFAAGYLGLCLTYIADGIVFQRTDYTQAINSAEVMARKAVALDEGNASAHANLGYVYRLKGQMLDALREARRALALDPNSAEANGVIGVTQTFTGEHASARRALCTALSLGLRDPRRPVWRTHMAHSWYLEGRYSEAADAARLAVAEFPSYPNAHQCLAACLGQLGETDAAVAAMKRVIALTPGPRELAIKSRRPFVRAGDHAHILAGLRKAGWSG